MIKIKNVSGSTKFYGGVELVDDAEYNIQDAEMNLFSNDDLLLTDLASMDCLIWSKTNAQASTGSEAINIIKDLAPKKVITTAGDGIDDLRARSMIFTAAANSTTTHYFAFDVTLSFRGGIMFSNGSLGDYVRITVCDKDNILGYGAGLELEEYVKKLAVFPNFPVELIDLNVSEPANQGLYFKIEYTNTHASNEAKVAINFLSYKVG